MQNNIGKVIKHLRKERGITQEELACTLGVTAQAVSRWENGIGIPDISLLVPIANYFKVSMDTLFSRECCTIDKRVCELLEQIENDELSHVQKNELLNNALSQFPDHPDILYAIVQNAIFVDMLCDDPKAVEDILITALKAADTFIRISKDANMVIRVKSDRIGLLTDLGRYIEAEQAANEFKILVINEHMHLARICRKQKKYSEEITHIQESIARILGCLADEIEHLGRAYWSNGEYDKAYQVLTVDLELPNILLSKNGFCAPLQNYYAIAGFEAALCLVMDKRYDEAIDLLELIFEKGISQCDHCTNRTPIDSPLLCNIDPSPYHGEVKYDDYLYQITMREFEPLKGDPRYDKLVERFNSYDSRKSI
ncbi:MAG: helix-turn-helix domain-containing protein [Clostridia bacterium]|nr:helix-turn-helix domain-containing protein [Clostridia bacterium]